MSFSQYLKLATIVAVGGAASFFAPAFSELAPNASLYAQDDDCPSIGDDFPTLGDDFPVVEQETVDDENAPPQESELSDFARNGANVPEPSGEYEHVDEDDFRPTPKRQSIADREAKDEEIESAYKAWLEEQKRKKKANSDVPKYLRPIESVDINDENSPFARLKQNETEDKTFMRRVTADTFSMMQDEAPSARELEEWEKETPTPVDWSKYALSFDTIRSWFGMGPDEKAALALMREACLKQKEYSTTKDRKCLKEAAQLYEKAAERWPGPALRPNEAKKNPYGAAKSGCLIEEDGLFFAGECWFFYKDYGRAVSCFRALVQTYNASIYKDTAMKRLFFIGNYWVECSEKETKANADKEEKGKPTLRTFAAAKKAYETIFLNDPSDTGLAPAALYALANAYMRRGVKQGDGSYASAAEYYRQLYDFYPASKYAEDACRLRMIALHRSYQGVYYDAAPLDEARKLAETILQSGRGNMDVIYEELDNIKEEQARRLYALGQYYERRGNYASARSYYMRLAEEHASSEFATLGAQAYEHIQSKPAQADQLSWIRPIAPFLPKDESQYFELEPKKDLASLAAREERLDSIGRDDELDDSKEPDKTAQNDDGASFK